MNSVEGVVKICTKCGGEGPFPQETKRGKVVSRAECSVCRSRRTATHNNKKYEDRRVQLDALKGTPCVDCDKLFPPCAMDFDHRDSTTKVQDVSQMLMGSWQSVLSEVAKCDVVCATCHRLRTWMPSETTGRKRALLRQLKNVPCADCGGSFHYCQMDFDHVRGEKRGDVSKLTGASLAVLLEEVSKCSVVCANCHRQRTHARGQGLKVEPKVQRFSLPVWASAHDWHKLAGTMDDGAVAALAGITRKEVFEYRKQSRTPSYSTKRTTIWQPLVGSMSDADVARVGDVTRQAVRQYRHRMGIAVFPKRAVAA